MIAEGLISHELFPLKKTDTAESAVILMHDWSIAHLPAVENNKVLGYVSLDEASNAPKTTRVEKLVRNDKQFIASFHQHLFELLKIFAETGLSTISVLNSEANFSGIISYREIFRDLYRESSLAQPGGIIMLEMSSKDYSLAELSRIAEYNDIKIIDVFINTAIGESNNILVSLKFNTTDLKNVISSFERHRKIIRSVHQADIADDSFSSRYDWLIKYLNT